MGAQVFPAAGSSRVVRRQQVFTASGTFTVPSGVTDVEVLIVGGGASGMIVSGALVAQGSGGGAAIRRRFTLTTSTVNVVVGAGGTATLTTAAGQNLPGTAGQASSFGGLAAPGGLPATLLAASFYYPGAPAGPGSGAGGFITHATGGTNSFATPGGDGFEGYGAGSGAASGNSSTGSLNYSTPGGRGGVPGLSTTQASVTRGLSAAPNTGAAGGPVGSSASLPINSGGGDGGSGIVIVEWDVVVTS